jgi:hypothetical protein
MVLVSVCTAAVGAYFVWHESELSQKQMQSPKTHDPVASLFDPLKWVGAIIVGILAVGAYLKNYLQRREESEDKIPTSGTGKTVFKKEYNVNEMEAILEKAYAEREAKEYVGRMKAATRQAEIEDYQRRAKERWLKSHSKKGV